MNKLFIFLILIFTLFIANASAQQVTITVISESGHSFGPASPDPNKVKVEEEVRHPTAADVVNGVKNKSQVAITVPQTNGTARWAHSLRVRAVNLTVYNGTNENNKTVYYNDVRVYDPTTNNNYTIQMAYIADEPGRAYVNWNGWVPIRDVIIIKSHAPPKPGSDKYRIIKPFKLILNELFELRDFELPKFH